MIPFYVNIIYVAFFRIRMRPTRFRGLRSSRMAGSRLVLANASRLLQQQGTIVGRSIDTRQTVVVGEGLGW